MGEVFLKGAAVMFEATLIGGVIFMGIMIMYVFQ